MKCKIYILIILFFVVTFIIGCPGSPGHIAMMEKKELTDVSDKQLATAIGETHSEKLLEKSISRGIFTSKEIMLIREQEIEKGISELALRASWGKPNHINKKISRNETIKHFVYGELTFYSVPTDVYVKNGNVSSWGK